VALARQLIERCKDSQNQHLNRLAADTERRLNGILNSVKPSGPEVIYQLHHEIQTYSSEKWRQDLLEEVLRMQRELKG